METEAHKICRMSPGGFPATAARECDPLRQNLVMDRVCLLRDSLYHPFIRSEMTSQDRNSVHHDPRYHGINIGFRKNIFYIYNAKRHFFLRLPGVIQCQMQRAKTKFLL